MKKNILSIGFLTIVLAIASPMFVLAQTPATITINPNIPGVYDMSTVGPCGWIVNFYNFALIISGILAFGAIVFGGVKYATSVGNPSAQSEGRAWIMSALLGLLLLGGAYLILYTINPSLTSCFLPKLSSISIAPAPTVPSGGEIPPSGGNGVPPNAGDIPARIAAAATAYRGTNTSAGPSSGTLACAWAVNNVLARAGIAPLDSDSVQSMENALQSGRGTLVDPSSAVAGDIVIQAADGHVGICLNNGCTRVISNASGNATFSWISSTSFEPSYRNGPGRIYQVNR